MPETFTFELVSPDKLLLSKTAAMVTVPGGEGEYGVLPGHAPMITTIKAGVIQVYGETDTVVTDRIFVANGFAEVTQSRFTVLADEAVAVTDLDRAALQEEVKTLSGQIASAAEKDVPSLQAKYDVVYAKLQAAA